MTTFVEQVANIHEILGHALEAEALLLWGKEIALRQCLPLYLISFSSMLGTEFFAFLIYLSFKSCAWEILALSLAKRRLDSLFSCCLKFYQGSSTAKECFGNWQKGN